jgi:hypothetical protein
VYQKISLKALDSAILRRKKWRANQVAFPKRLIEQATIIMLHFEGKKQGRGTNIEKWVPGDASLKDVMQQKPVT